MISHVQANPEKVSITESIRAIYNPSLLAEKVVLVTGGSRGIGRCIAIALGAVSAKVIVNYSGSEKAAKETVSEIILHGGQAFLSRFNVANFTEVQDTIKALEKEHGSIDILINNAGISKDNLLVRYKEEEWDNTLNTNLKGSFNCARAVGMGMMRKRSGKIINISSVVGLSGNAGQCAYAASKAGLFGLTKSLALELASRNVQVNAIAPGYVATDMTSSLGADITEKIKTKIPAENLGNPIDIANAVLFLASPAAQYMTGQTLVVDGGMVMS